MSSYEGEKRGRFFANAPHKNSDNMRGILGAYLPSVVKPVAKVPHRHTLYETKPRGIERWQNALRMLEDVYCALTTMDEQSGGGRSKGLSRLGACILEVRNAADEAIAALTAHAIGPCVLPDGEGASELQDEMIQQDTRPVLQTLPSPVHSHDDTKAEAKLERSPLKQLRDVKVTRKAPNSPKRSPVKQGLRAYENDRDRQLVADLHAEFHEKKAAFQLLRWRVHAAENVARSHVEEEKVALQRLQRLKLDLDS
ncbi:hypothetical protein SDRG_03351 [Saprolegnia diclina VS20]|uniref:Uncharacterized protein n=1 Tax=Saprolegnia diclina (strain VS20) TaxID=1156394 RepID=T0QYJ6_SAPDV|nr:hypothetical protein SDRG_03351 [Saprolegnia diclina VS20]EQC39145.1 hypothetical protein SDRG_03351 [Saprolegnia diclina VS20]|eukprot:XP_008607206.1 hypothetical protein SDRG_03351 [Saprolegnia diclina VS20]